jgi:hypothetical protein
MGPKTGIRCCPVLISAPNPYCEANPGMSFLRAFNESVELSQLRNSLIS